MMMLLSSKTIWLIEDEKGNSKLSSEGLYNFMKNTRQVRSMVYESKTVSIYYEHRNTKLYVLTLESAKYRNVSYFKVIHANEYSKINTSEKEQDIIEYTDYDKYYSYKRVQQTTRFGLLFLTLWKEDTASDISEKNKAYEETDQEHQIDPYFIDANSFYEEVELKTKGSINYIEISSITDYIKMIDIYKVISLFIKCEDVLGRYINKLKMTIGNETINHVLIQDLSHLKEIAANQKNNILSEIQELYKSDTHVNETLEDNVKAFIMQLNNKDINQKRTFKATADPSGIIRITGDAYRTIKHIIRLYRSGEYSMYYRGVGRIIFPEMPRVFRDNHKYEEDRQYKSMIMSFPQEFKGLRYLDRLAKLQHFGLPTRLLDVSSNPLVALYMASNTVYTNDSKQEDWGEVILYFMAGEKERAYDSKSVLINAALVKLSYSEETTLFQFIRIHDVFFCRIDEEYRNILKEILNRCIHYAYDYGTDVSLPEHLAETLKNMISNLPEKVLWNEEERELAKHEFESAKTACDFCWACMRDVPWPRNGRNWRSIGEENNNNYCESIKKEDYCFLFKDVIHAYNNLLLTIRRENPAFENRIDIFQLTKSVHGNIGMTNERILAQSGSFIISGVDNRYINTRMLSTRSDGYIRMIIKNKKKITEELRILNITDATMLPDLSHKAEYITSQIDKSKILP